MTTGREFRIVSGHLPAASTPPERYKQPKGVGTVPCGRKRKRHKIATHKRKKKLRANRHKKKLR